MELYLTFTDFIEFNKLQPRSQNLFDYRYVVDWFPIWVPFY